jgi:hypothetical protein
MLNRFNIFYKYSKKSKYHSTTDILRISKLSLNYRYHYLQRSGQANLNFN